MAVELSIEGVKRLAVPIGESTRGTALTRILALKTSNGWLAEDGAIREWRFEGVTEQEGTVFLYGPAASGKQLAAVLALPLAEALPFFSRLAHALLLLAERSVPWFPLQTDSVVFTDSGGVLFLPAEIFGEIRDLRTFAVNRDSYESINHPDLKDEPRASFSIAALLFRVITGRFPITGADAEELHEQARKLAITAPVNVVPELLPEISAFIMAGLGRARRAPVSLSEWAGRIDAWQKEKLFRALSPQEREKAVREAGARREESEKSFRRRMFWEKNWKLMAILAGVVVVIGVVLGSIVRNALAPRVTKGFAPARVVEAFYTGMNSLDSTTMQACVIGKAGQGEINEVTTLFVTSRVAMGYEGKSNIVSAADWDAAGRPALVSPETLYGVTGLSVTQEQGEPDPIFMVTYDKWMPASAPDTAKPPSLDVIPQSEGFHTTDRVWLKKDKGDWVIYRIDRLRQDPLPPPKTGPAPAATPGTAIPGGQ